MFAGHVRDAFATFRPTVVALELPDGLAPELEWALRCWPTPVCVLGRASFVPLVPGDSVVEAYRLARRDGVPVRLIDLRHDAPIDHQPIRLPGAECAARVGAQFVDTVSALVAAAGPGALEDQRREAFMAAHLAKLMATHARVLWVGGFGHWPALRARLIAGEHEALPKPRRAARGRRFRLDASALYEATRRLPYLVSRFGEAPGSYDEGDALRALAIEALTEHADRDVRLITSPSDRPPESWEQPESGSSPDVARMLVYARNLAAMRGVGDRPELADLLTAASAVIGNRYAGRLWLLAMENRYPESASALPELRFQSTDTRTGFRIGTRWTAARPCWPLPQTGNGRLVEIGEVARRSSAAPWADLPPARPGDDKYWRCYPPDEESYEAFVRHVLRRASLGDRGDETSAPFQSGMRDGLDARATVRHWHDGTVHVRETTPPRAHVTNGIVDFTNDRENTGVHLGLDRGGWADPNLRHFGSVSRNVRSEVLRTEPCELHRLSRALSFVTLDCASWGSREDGNRLYDEVILPLVQLPPAGNDLYGWLDVMFAFCPRKTVAYFSRYVPSARVHRVARKHGVRVVHVPLARVPTVLVERSRRFRFFRVTKAQWGAVKGRIAEGRGAWGLG